MRLSRHKEYLCIILGSRNDIKRCLDPAKKFYRAEKKTEITEGRERKLEEMDIISVKLSIEHVERSKSTVY